MSKLKINRDTLILFFLVIAVVLAVIYVSRNFYSPAGDEKKAEKITKEISSEEEIQPDDPPRISSTSLKELIESDKEVLILNPESRENFYKKHIPGSISFPHDEILANVDSIPNDKIVIVTSSGDESGCNLSKQVARTLIENGFPDVRDHHDGWIGWEKDGYPTVTNNELNVAKISVEDLEKKIKDSEEIFLIDVRSSDSFKEGYIGKAHSIPYYDFSKQKSQIPHNQNIIIYDENGKKSDLVGSELLKDGYTQVKALVGGFDAWKLKSKEISQQK